MPALTPGVKSPAELKADQLRQQMKAAAQLTAMEEGPPSIGHLELKGLHSPRAAPPSRDRVSAAIALVRARQAARYRSSNTTEQPSQASPTSPRASIISTIVASRKAENDSPARSPLSPAKRNSPARLAEAHRRNLSLRRSPLSPKSQDPLPSAPAETSRNNELNGAIDSSPKATPKSPKSGAFFPDFYDANAIGNRQLAKASLTPDPEENNNQENSPQDDRHEMESPPESSRNDLISNIRATPGTVAVTPLGPAENVSASIDSDECTLDTQMLKDVGLFIDAVHNKQSAKVPEIHRIEGKRTLQSTQGHLHRPTSSESTDDEFITVTPETLAGIGQYIDALAKPKDKEIQSSETSSSDADDMIPVETKVGIGAFIDALHNKSPSPDEAKHTLYLSSSGDSSVDQNVVSDVDEYYQRDSTHHGVSGDDEDLRLLEEVLSDRVEMSAHDVNGGMSTIRDPANPVVGASPSPSELEGDEFFEVDSSPSKQNAVEVQNSEVVTESYGDAMGPSSASVSHSPNVAASEFPCDANPLLNHNVHDRHCDANVEVAEGFEMTLVGNSDDALDDAVNAALIGEIGSSISSEEVIVRNYPASVTNEGCKIHDDVSEQPLPGQVDLVVSELSVQVKSFGKDGKTEGTLSGENGVDQLYSNQATESGEREAEISSVFAPLGSVEMSRLSEAREIDGDTSELVNAFLGVASTRGTKALIGGQDSHAEVKTGSVFVPPVTNNSPEVRGDDPVHMARSDDGVPVDSSPIFGNIIGNGLDQVAEECSSKIASNFDVDGVAGKFPIDTSLDDDAGELVNAFLSGSNGPIAPCSPKAPDQKRPSTALRSPSSKEAGIEDIMEELVSKVGSKNAAVFVHLAWGASGDEIKTLKRFIKAAVPFLSGQSAPLVAEAQVRSVAFQVGLAADDLEQVIDHIFGEVVCMVPESLSADTADLTNILNDSKFENIEEIDESANISAFLSRMNALEAGGHFGETEATDAAADEAVEVDFDLGFVNRILEPVGSEEAPWWNEDVDEAFADPTSVTKSSQILMPGSDVNVSSPRQPERMMSQRSQSASPQKLRLPRSRSMRNEADPEQVRALQNQKAQISSQQRLDNARTFILNSVSVEDVPPSLSLTKVPSLIGDIETMLEAREKSANRSKNAKQAKWISPWEKRWVTSGAERNAAKSISMVKFEASKAPRLEGVAAAMRLSNWTSRPERHDRRLPVKQQWRLAYKERTKNHPGYSTVDVFSLYDASIVVGENHPYDDEPWEYRDVKQRFLHEQSLSMSRNWFGTVLRKRGNDRYREPVANPKSMEMPMENLPGEGEWLEEWYTTWQQRHNETKKKSKTGQDDEFDSDSDDSYGSETCNTYTVYTEGDETTRGDDDTATYSRSVYTGISGSVYTSRRSQRSRYTRRSRGYEEDDDSWEDPPECGTFQNVKQKIGERLSLVRYEHLSSLRQSRWRKRYFPRGTFPYK
ncbi:hypothetical protein MHU86_6850 [Fragilaria crotonensis]|nr:hypothetical protein MHU86_6850 [Fragilaria crotonensis]